MAEEIYYKQDSGEPYKELLRRFQEKVPYLDAAQLFNGDQGPEYIANYAMNYQIVKPGDLSKDELIDLVREIINSKDYKEYEIDLMVQKLCDGVIDPNITDYIYYDNLTPEEVVNKALSYKPMNL